MAILNYTTKIEAYQTINEIQQILSKKGVTKMIIDNDSSTGLPAALTFFIMWNGNPVAFMLPCNFEGVLRAMKKDKNIPNRLLTEQQALRVGWRIIKMWVDAQMAIVEAEAATLAEVFLPYAITKSGSTLYNHLSNDNQLLLTQ